MRDGINIPAKVRYNFVVGFFVKYFNPPDMEKNIKIEYRDKILNNIIRICTEIPNDNFGNNRSRVLSLEIEKDENDHDRYYFHVLNDKEMKDRIMSKIVGTKGVAFKGSSSDESNIIEEVTADAKAQGDAKFTTKIIEYYCEHKQRSIWFTYVRREYLLLGYKIYADHITLYSRLESFYNLLKIEFCHLTDINTNNIYLQQWINSFSNLEMIGTLLKSLSSRTIETNQSMDGHEEVFNSRDRSNLSVPIILYERQNKIKILFESYTEKIVNSVIRQQYVDERRLKNTLKTNNKLRTKLKKLQRQHNNLSQQTRDLS